MSCEPVRFAVLVVGTSRAIGPCCMISVVVADVAQRLYAMRDYRRLEIWRRSHALAIAIHGAARRMRGTEFATLRSQLTRAADSVAANIVEGCSADSAREFARFLDVSIKSASETEHHLLNARDRRILADRPWRRLSDEAVEIRRMTYAYRKRLLEDDA